MGLVVQLTDRRTRFLIKDEGGDVVPGGRAWRNAESGARAAFWEILARYVRIRKDEELEAGLDADGNPIEPAKYRTGRYRGQTGPGLMPDRELSRTRRLFDVAVGSNHITGYWRGDWSRIVGYHARGVAGKGRPIIRRGEIVGWIGIPGATTGIVRNVVGLSNDGLNWCISMARDEWRTSFDDDLMISESSPATSRLELLRGVLRYAIRQNDRDAFRKDRPFRGVG